MAYMKDIIDPENPQSVPRQIFQRAGEIVLSELDLPIYEGKGQEITMILPRRGYQQEIQKIAEHIIKKAEQEGFPRNMFTALYESILNAYQHGNKKDPNKKIKINFSIDESSLEIAIQDEGGILDPDFVPFVLKQREIKGQKQDRLLDFYKFAGKQKPETNNGTGTSFMHQYADRVTYFKSPTGGLVVILEKLKENQK
jgi:anti-sigma regulatory factor (Ser/Thr protein kinase)